MHLCNQYHLMTLIIFSCYDMNFSAANLCNQCHQLTSVIKKTFPCA